MTTEELAFVAIDGHEVSCSHAVLIDTPTGWHLELEDVPADSCPFTSDECSVSVDTWEGDHYSGRAKATYASTSEEESYLLLTGVADLERSCAEREEEPERAA